MRNENGSVSAIAKRIESRIGLVDDGWESEIEMEMENATENGNTSGKSRSVNPRMASAIVSCLVHRLASGLSSFSKSWKGGFDERPCYPNPKSTTRCPMMRLCTCFSSWLSAMETSTATCRRPNNRYGLCVHPETLFDHGLPIHCLCSIERAGARALDRALPAAAIPSCAPSRASSVHLPSFSPQCAPVSSSPGARG